MWLSIFVYYGLGIFLYSIAKSYCAKQPFGIISKSSLKFLTAPEIVISLLLFAIVAGIRYNVGVDNLSYIRSYEFFKNYGHFERKTFEVGYVAVITFFAKLGTHFSVVNGFWALLQIGFVYYAFKKDVRLLPFLGLLIMTGPYFLDWMNGVRQTVVECVLIWALGYVSKKKYLIFCTIIFICSFIHHSAILLILLCFLPFIKLPKNRWILVGILICCTIIGDTPFWIHNVKSLSKYISFLGYERYVANLDSVLSNLSSFSFGPRRICTLLLNIIIIIYYPNLSKQFDEMWFELYFKMFFIGACLYNLLANTSLEFLRPVGYFTIFALPITSCLLYSVRKGRPIYILTIILSCSYALFSILSGEETILYKTFFTEL